VGAARERDEATATYPAEKGGSSATFKESRRLGDWLERLRLGEQLYLFKFLNSL